MQKRKNAQDSGKKPALIWKGDWFKEPGSQLMPLRGDFGTEEAFMSGALILQRGLPQAV